MHDIEQLRLMKWSPKFHGTLQNPSAPSGKVDMWELTDDRTGETLVTVSVPHGRSDIAAYIAACCGNPVRWVTSMWRSDSRKDGLDDPDDVLGKQSREIADHLFAALIRYMGDRQANGWAINDALSYIWFTFCGQLNHEMRGQLLFKFLQLATTDYDPAIPLHKKAPTD